jgi:hypothetical protein
MVGLDRRPVGSIPRRSEAELLDWHLQDVDKKALVIGTWPRR